jgi:hypothetical protein
VLTAQYLYSGGVCGQLVLVLYLLSRFELQGLVLLMLLMEPERPGSRLASSMGRTRRRGLANPVFEGPSQT